MTHYARVRSALDLLAPCLCACLMLAGCGGGNGGGSGESPQPPAAPPPPAAPTISLAQPASGSLNRTVTLSASVTAPAGVTRVEFLVDGTVVGTSTTSPFQFAWDTSAVADGAHSLTARVTDSANTVVTSTAVSVTVTNTATIQFVLTPNEIFPRPDSTGSGSGTLAFNLVSGAITGKLRTDVAGTTRASIHEGYAGAPGPAIVELVNNTADPLQWDAAPGSALTAAQIDELLRGQLYIKVSSALFQSGVLRGQLKTENVNVVFTAMRGGFAVPLSTNDATGLAATTVDTVAGNVTVHVNTSAEDATEAYVRKAAAGASSTTNLISLAQGATPIHWSVERQAITAADRTDFASNGWYAEVGTPRGAIRGQIQNVTLAQLQSSIFGQKCSGCHTGNGDTLPGSMNLSSASATFDALVNRASRQQPNVLRVAPGRPDDSYLVHKLEGRNGISGVRMPAGGNPLVPADIERVRSWIFAGAQNN